MLRRIDRVILGMMGLGLCVPGAGWAFRAAWPDRAERVLSKIEGPPLQGMVTPATRPASLPAGWWGGELQAWAADAFDASYGLRRGFVRAANQIDYSLFRSSRMYNGTILIGRDGSLFERMYVEDACRMRPPVPDDELDAFARKLVRARDLLRARGVAFEVLVTPQKAAIYPEDMPEAYRRAARPGPRNYDRLVGRLAAAGVPFVDGHRITLAAKPTTPVPLFPRGGTHWQTSCAFDTCAALVDALRSQGLPLRRVRVVSTVIDTHPTGTDADLHYMLNLADPRKQFPVPHPEFRPADDLPPVPRAVFVGGSFTPLPIEIMARNGVFAQVDFHYYLRLGRSTYRGDSVTMGPGGRSDWGQELRGASAVVLEVNESVGRFGPDSHCGLFLDDLFATTDPPVAAAPANASAPPAPGPQR